MIIQFCGILIASDISIQLGGLFNHVLVCRTHIKRSEIDSGFEWTCFTTCTRLGRMMDLIDLDICLTGCFES